jgi:hypothetical protein
MVTAPWETPDANTAPAPIVASSGATLAPWETPSKTATPSPGYFSSVGSAASKVASTQSVPGITDLQTVGALASGAVAPILAAGGGRMNYSTDENGGLIAEADPTDTRGYIQRKNDVTYQPTDPNAAARLGLIGATTKPVGDALHHVASVFSDDPDTQEAISDTLGTAAGLFGGEALNAVKGLTKFGPAAATPVGENIITHPAVVAANDLADKYGIKLTKGQQVQQAATGLAPEETATAKALTVPYQIEAQAATQPTVVGKTYNNHFATQQNTLAGHVQDVADAVRAAGDDATATKIEGTLVDKSPGVQAVNGSKLQTVVSKDLIDDPELSGKLDELNDLSGVIDPPPKAPAASPTIVGRITDKLANVPAAVGGAIGGAAGFKVGSIVGHPILGAEAGYSLGAGAGNKLASMFARGPGDISTLTTADITRLAKSAGISPEEMAQRLSQQPTAPAAASSVSGGPLVEPPPQSTSPAASPSPDLVPSRPMDTIEGPYQPEMVTPGEMPVVEPTGISYNDHKALMESDPAYRKAALLQAGIIEGAPATAISEVAPTGNRAALGQRLNEYSPTEQASMSPEQKAWAAQYGKPGGSSVFSGTPNLEDRINANISDRLAASRSMDTLTSQLQMMRDPVYRRSRLLQAGIIEDEPTLADQLQQSINAVKAKKLGGKQGGAIDPALLMAPFKIAGKFAPFLDDAAAVSNQKRDQ